MTQTTTPSLPEALLLAEAVTFDPGLVVAVFIVFLLTCAAALAVAVTGIVSGIHSGRHPELERPRVAWWCCIVVETVVALLATITRASTPLLAAAWIVLASAVAARWLTRPATPAR